MNDLASNLLPLGLLVIGLIGIGVILWWKGRDPRTTFVIALIPLTFFAIGVVDVLQSSPGRIDVIDDDRNDDWLPPVIDQDKLTALRIPWDSEETADWPAAGLLSKLSDIAYQPYVEAEPAFEELGFDRVVPFNSATMFGYVVSHRDVAVVAFRGSEQEFGDWWTNVSRTPMPIDGKQIHAGFWTGYLAMKEQIESALDRANAKHIWACGHSLGGALAVCCAYDFDRTGRRLDGVMTFGQPMVARQTLADEIDDRLLGRYARFVNRDDMVARIPPSYRPCGRLVWFTDEGLKRSPRKRMLFGAPSGDSPFGDSDIAEIEPVTESEYQRLVSDQSQPQVRRNINGEILLEGNSPYIVDHSMSLYIDEVRSLLGILF
jgi:triacylglycerol lipase